MEFLGKSFRKSTSSSGGLHLHSMCFVFKQCVVFLCKETIKHGKPKKQSSGSVSDLEIIRHQVLIPVSEVQVRACPPPQSEQELDFKWELIQLKTNAQGKRSEKIFRLSNRLVVLERRTRCCAARNACFESPLLTNIFAVPTSIATHSFVRFGKSSARMSAVWM